MLKGITRAVGNLGRGVGRIARGNVREGLRDIGGSAKTLAPALAFIPGVGTAAALGIGAVGGALSSRSGASANDFLRGAATGAGRAGVGVGAKALLPGIGGMVRGGGAAGLPPVPGAAVTPMNVAAPMGMASSAAPGAGAYSGGGGIGGVVTGIGRWIEKNPAPAAQIGATIAQTYGASQIGKAEDRRAGMEETALQRQWAEDDRLRDARQRAWQIIQARRGNPAPFGGYSGRA